MNKQTKGGIDWFSYIIGRAAAGGGGSGGSGATLLYSHDYTVSTTSTSMETVDTVDLGSVADLWKSDKLIFYRVRDKAGLKANQYFGSDVYIYNSSAANSTMDSVQTFGGIILTGNSSGNFGLASTAAYGVVPTKLMVNDGRVELTIRSRYSASLSQTIDGTFTVEVYLAD